VSFPDRFELLELLREDMLQEEQVQTFRARERATGRAVEAHLSASPELLAKLESLGVIDQGSYEGKFYVVTTPPDLDSAGAWRIKPHIKPQEKEPGDFTRMFELRQAPEPVAAHASKPVEPVAAPASDPGQFTRAFQKPAAPLAAPAASPAPGHPGEFTRMFQKPVPPAVPPVPEPAAQPTASGSSAQARIPPAVIVIGIVLLSAIAVFVLMRTLY